MLDLEHENRPEILRQAALLLERENRRLIEKTLQLQRQIESLKGADPKALSLQLQILEEELSAVRRRLFAASSEKLPQGDSEEAAARRAPREGHGPTEQPRLPAVEVLHELPLEERTCPQCGGELSEWEGQYEESEEVTLVERKFLVARHQRKKYRCSCNACVKTAPGPVKLFPGARYSPEFAVEVAVSKYSEHLPLERQVRIMKREGLEVTSQTLWDYSWALYQVLQPLEEKISSHVLSSPVVFADETPWEFLGKKGVDRKRWWAWAVARENAASYRILDSRSKEAARKILEGYSGTLVADGYSAYGALLKKDGTGPPAASFRQAACWAHARRKFFEVKDYYPAECGWILEKIGDLYEVERFVPSAGDEESRLRLRRRLREEKSKPLTEEIQAWAKGLLPATLPQGGLGRALGYLLELWPGLTLFLKDPQVPLDNNAAERALRGVVVGRKNHYGSKSKRGALVTAFFYSVIETCKLCRVDPKGYLRGATTAFLSRKGAYPLPHELPPNA
ncbi:MAG: IS66 family transposase [Bdellovibrionota bacterium]